MPTDMDPQDQTIERVGSLIGKVIVIALILMLLWGYCRTLLGALHLI